MRKEPTWTKLVLELLEMRNDFMTTDQVRAELGGIDTQANRNRISAALIHLRKRKAIDCIIEPDGRAWWFATPWSDDRIKRVDERIPEVNPRHRRPGFKRKREKKAP